MARPSPLADRGSHTRMPSPFVIAVIVLGAAIAASPKTWHASPDVKLYAGYAAQTFAGHLPYRDFFLAYPPGVLLPILPAGVAGTRTGPYAIAFALEMLVALVLLLALMTAAAGRLGLGRGRTIVALLPLALSPVLLGPVPLPTGRFDLFPALAVEVALVLLLAGRDTAAAAALGLGTAAKLYPAALLPLVLIVAARKAGARASLVAAAAFLGTVIVVVGPFAALAPHGLAESLRFQLGRPPSYEGLVASMSYLAHQWAGFSVGLISTHDTFGLGGSRGKALGLAQTAALVVLLVWILVRTVRVGDRGRRSWLCAAATLTAVVTFGQALSPQFLLWLLPVVPLVDGALGLAATVALTVASLLTRLFWATPHNENIDAHTPVLLLASRNLCLVAALAALLVALSRARPHA